MWKVVLPGNLNSVELHARHYRPCQQVWAIHFRFDLHTENSGVLLVLGLGVVADHGAEIVVVNLLLVGHQELAPPILALLALHLVLVDSGGRVELGEVGLEVLVDFVVDLGQAEGRALDHLEDGPVGLHVLDD